MELTVPPAKIEYQPIGVIHSPFPKPEGAPIQPSRAEGVEGSVEVFPAFSEGLADLEGFSHIFLLCHLHRARGCRLRVVPFLDTVPRGVFATRAPSRPNPIGLSLVELKAVRGNLLTVAGIDMVDGTPVLDIKPYIAEFDRRDRCRSGWLESAQKRTRVADDRFEA
jgi:tRNA-Thr(GGU) m(6)t(6)A37 methyltransferase TsaA